MSPVDPEALVFALSQVDDGRLFEKFALDFLAKHLGYRFVPAGEMRDRGVDGFEHTSAPEGKASFIYQISVESDWRGKVTDSLRKLKANRVKVSKFFYVTNRKIKHEDQVSDALTEEFRIPVTIWDIDWFKVHINDSEQTVSSYQIWIESHFHEYSRPGKAYEVADLEGDPRLYVFLRQQLDNYAGSEPLDHILADTLILFALEGTNPDLGVLRTREEILRTVFECIQFDPTLLGNLIDQRLKALSTKPRRINHHRKEDAFCLPFETRLEIENRNIRDLALHEEFRGSAAAKLSSYLQPDDVQIRHGVALIEQAIHSLFRQQGLDLTDFILFGGGADSVEKSLPDVISDVVDKSQFVVREKVRVKRALLATLREIVYTGTPTQLEYLRRLSRTYTMLFLLQCDPKLSLYFTSLASKLTIYVDNSITIPALSEYYLDEHNRRHWNLLCGARDAGVRLVVNETIIRELARHFRHIALVYDREYAGKEDVYAEEFIPEIMIRAYFYAYLRGQVGGFAAFLDNFASVQSPQLHEQLVEWLKHEFGIQFVTEEHLGLAIDKDDIQRVADALVHRKAAATQAENDASVFLTIHAIRAKQNETGEGGIFGYRTWWLSKDTTTEAAAREVFGTRYGMTCYIRPDFLYNSISLAPTKAAVDRAFNTLLPSLVGVSMSYHLPPEVTSVVHQFVQEHHDKNPARVRAILRELSEALKAGPLMVSRDRVRDFLARHESELALS